MAAVIFLRIVIHPTFPTRGWDDGRQGEEANRSVVGGKETLVLMSVLASVCVVFHPTRIATLYDPYTESLWTPPPPHPSPPPPLPFVSEQKYYLPKTTAVVVGRRRWRNFTRHNKTQNRNGRRHNTHDESGVIIISGKKGNEGNSIKKCRPTVKTNLPTRTPKPRRRTSAPTLLLIFLLSIITRPYPVVNIALLIGCSFPGILRSFFDFIFRLNFIEWTTTMCSQPLLIAIYAAHETDSSNSENLYMQQV